MPSATDLRAGVSSLATLAARDLDVIWSTLRDAVTIREALSDVLPGLVESYGAAAATLAADWYDALRDEAGAAGSFTAITADVGPSGSTELAGWGVSPLFQAVPDYLAARVLIAGGLQRRIANASRATVTASAVADPAAAGWRRVGTPRCDFCRMLIGRGAVYREATADFESHDHCHCAAVPEFDH